MILSSHGLSAPGFFQLLSISHRTRMRIVVIYDVIILRFRLLFSRILIDYENNENKTPSKIYTITVITAIYFLAIILLFIHLFIYLFIYLFCNISLSGLLRYQHIIEETDGNENYSLTNQTHNSLGV